MSAAGQTSQERLEWLYRHQPRNRVAIEALELRLGVGRRLTAVAPLVAEAQPTAQPVDSDFYDKLKKLFMEEGGTVYACCVKLGLKGGQNWQPMSEAERMVCRLTNSGQIVWKASPGGVYPDFQQQTLSEGELPRELAVWVKAF